MNSLTTILKKLPSLKTSAEFGTAVATLEAEHSEVTAAVAALAGKREDVIFEGGDLAKLEREISAAEAIVRTLGVALDGARSRQGQAVEGERTAALEAVADDARKLNKTLRARLIAFGENAKTLADHAREITKLRATINTANNTIREAGRADLVSTDPINELAATLDRQVADPVAALVVPEFWPHSPDDGAAIMKLKK